MNTDPLDKRKEAIERQMNDAADDKAHRDEAVWLLTHMEHLFPRFEENRDWYERWKFWTERQKANE